MNSRRVLKAAAAIRNVVSMAILTELRDPRVAGVTVTGVEVAPDMRSAKVYVSVMGDDKKQQLCMHGLQNSAGFLQQKIAENIDTRYVPRLQFVLDLGVKKSLAVARILQEVLPSHQDDESVAEGVEAEGVEADASATETNVVESDDPDASQAVNVSARSKIVDSDGGANEPGREDSEAAHAGPERIAASRGP